MGVKWLPFSMTKEIPVNIRESEIGYCSWGGGNPETAFVVSLGGRMRRAQCLLMLAGLFWAFSLWGQNSPSLSRRLTNQDIISMVELGLSEDVVIAKIRSMSATGADTVSFDTSIEGMKALKGANVPDSVIKVMINPTSPPQSTNVVASAAMTVDPNLPPVIPPKEPI